jgi:hypothetical protein
MEGRRRPGIGDLYQSDLERYLFAPASNRQRPIGQQESQPVGEWIMRTVQVNWSRWKELAMSLYLS